MTAPLRVAYVMSRFPKITETFVLYEMVALERMGAAVELFPLVHEHGGPRHPEARTLEERAHYLPFLSWRIVAANLARLRASPRKYLALWWEVLSGTWGSANFLLGAIAILPKTVLMANRLQQLGVSHVHAHFASHPALAALVLHRMTGIPFSFTAHGSDLHVERRMLRAKVRASAFAVTVSAYNRDLMMEECGGEAGDKILVIHCGTDSASAFSRKEPRRADDGVFHIACVASLEEVKGHRFLLDACCLLKERGLRFRCDLVGEGPLRANIVRRVADLGLQDRVRLHGALPRPEVARVLADADAAVLASYPTRSGKREGIPVALMEAMAIGLPVVASGLSGIPELVEHERTGLLVAPGDPWALAEALACLARDATLRTRLGEAARAKVAEEFEIRRNARALFEATLAAAPRQFQK
jgi:glycosyltransferase involved in cell wall biosynthesis